jgi:hypothetical protein
LIRAEHRIAVEKIRGELKVAEEKIKTAEEKIRAKLKVAEEIIKTAEAVAEEKIKTAEVRNKLQVSLAEKRIADKFLKLGFAEEYTKYQKQVLPDKFEVLMSD